MAAFARKALRSVEARRLLSGMRRDIHSRSRPRWQRIVAVSVVGLSVSLPVTAAIASTSVYYSFNEAGQLDAAFNGVGPQVNLVSQAATGGIGDSGSIAVPLSGVNAVYTTKSSYSLGPVGSTYTFSAFIKSEGNSGYSGVGFTTASPATASTVTVYRPDNALGVSVHGGGFEFHNGPTNYSGSWGGASGGALTAVKPSTCSDLINNNTDCGSPDKWFKFVFRIDRVSETLYTMRVEVWPANADGSLRFPDEATSIWEVRNIAADHITNAPSIYSYINFSGTRVTRFDDYRIDLGGGATIVEAGAPVVLTQGPASEASGAVTLAGNVTGQGTSAVIERGFVYSTSPAATVSGDKVVVGDGLGSFTGTTPPLPSGTYYLRAFATNAASTSYGSEVTITFLSDVEGGPSPGGGGDPEGQTETTTNVASGAPRIALDFSGGLGAPSESSRLFLVGLDLPAGSSARLTLYHPELQLWVQPVNGVSLNQAVALPSGLGAGQYTLVYTVNLPGGEVLALHRVIDIDASGNLASIGENIVGLGPASLVTEPKRLAYTGLQSSLLPWWALLTFAVGLLMILYSVRALRMIDELSLSPEEPRVRTPWEILATPIRVPGIDYTPGSGSAVVPSQSLSEAIRDVDLALSYLIAREIRGLHTRLQHRA